MSTPPINLACVGRSNVSRKMVIEGTRICAQPCSIKVSMLVPKMYSRKPAQRIADAHWNAGRHDGPSNAILEVDLP